MNIRSVPAAFLASVAFVGSVSAQDTGSTVWVWEDIELMGHRTVTRAQILEHVALDVGAEYTTNREQWRAWEQALRTQFDFHAVHVSAVRYVGGKAYLVVDVVERGDEAHDTFRAAPEGSVELPAGVMDLYAELRTYSRGLFRTGKPARELADEGFLDYDEPEMSRLAHELVSRTPPHRQALLEAIARDADAEKRAAAATLLNWAGDVEESIAAVLPYLDDPSMGVRNNLTRFMLHYVDRIESADVRSRIIDALVDQLRRPSHGDRNKALYAMLGLAKDDEHTRAAIIERAGDAIRVIAENSRLSNVRGPARELLSGAAAPAQWNQFRGPGGNGRAGDDRPLPSTLDPAKNLLWSCDIPPGHSSPCVWGDRIFITGATDRAVETICINRATGAVMWTQAALTDMFERRHRINSPATPTPTTDGERVYAYFGSCGLVCYDFDGNERWLRRMRIPENMYGTAASPIMAEGRLVFLSDNASGSFLEAIEPETGTTIWRKDRAAFTAGWSSPMCWSNRGVDEVVCYGVGWITAYALADGEERWSLPGVTEEPCVTPTNGDGLVFVTSYNMRTNPEVIGLPKYADLLEQYDGDDDGALTFAEVRSNRSILSRFDADGEGDHPLAGFFRFLDKDRDGRLTLAEWDRMYAFLDQFEFANGLIAVRPGDAERETEIVWQHARGVPECPSPLYVNGRVYMVKNGGIISCLDAATGALAFQERLGAGGPYYASPVAGDGKIYTASAKGVVTVLAAGDTLDVLARNSFGERIMATPALVDGTVYIRTETMLYAFH